jgi:hypothetical protein
MYCMDCLARNRIFFSFFFFFTNCLYLASNSASLWLQHDCVLWCLKERERKEKGVIGFSSSSIPSGFAVLVVWNFCIGFLLRSA